jgi:hypothetical protein
MKKIRFQRRYSLADALENWGPINDEHPEIWVKKRSKTKLQRFWIWLKSWRPIITYE